MSERSGGSFRQLVVVLLILGGVRAGTRSRAPATALPGEPVATAALADSAERLAASEARRNAPLAPGETLDPNTAPEKELDRLPGVGPSTAASIAAARDTLPFATTDDLLRVRGIGAGTLERLKPHLHVEGQTSRRSSRGVRPERAPAAARRVAVNLATAAELESLPGIGPAIAARMLEVRAGQGHFRRPADLLAVRGIGPAKLERLMPFLDFRTR